MYDPVICMASIVVGRSGSVRGMKGGVGKILSELKEKSERLEGSTVLQKLRKVSSFAQCSNHIKLDEVH